MSLEFPWRTFPRKRPPPTVRTMSTTRTKMQGLEESLSEDQEMDEEPVSSFCESCDSPVETMEDQESRPDWYESLKEQLFMYLRFGTINIWPTRDEINKTMSEDFKAKYSRKESFLTVQN